MVVPAVASIEQSNQELEPILKTPQPDLQAALQTKSIDTSKGNAESVPKSPANNAPKSEQVPYNYFDSTDACVERMKSSHINDGQIFPTQKRKIGNNDGPLECNFLALAFICTAI